MSSIRTQVALIGCCALSILIAASASAADLRGKFEQVSIGLTYEAVVSLMGSAPSSTQEASTLGVPTSRLRWDEGIRGSVYQVNFLFGRVVEKRVCDRRADC